MKGDGLLYFWLICEFDAASWVYTIEVICEGVSLAFFYDLKRIVNVPFPSFRFHLRWACGYGHLLMVLQEQIVHNHQPPIIAPWICLYISPLYVVDSTNSCRSMSSAVRFVWRVCSQSHSNDDQCFFDGHIGNQADHIVGNHDFVLFHLYSLYVLAKRGCGFDKILVFPYERLQEICQRSRQVDPVGTRLVGEVVPL